MASTQLLSFFIFSSLLLLFVSSSHSSSGNDAVAMETAPTDSSKVTLSLYYETLCPYCQAFIFDFLANAVESDLFTIIDLELVPWGNAHLLANKTILCQHGEDECYLNTVHACAINVWPDLIKHFNFIKCIEEKTCAKLDGKVPVASWKLCAKQLGLPDKPIKDCYKSGQGRKLSLKFKNKTDRLRPPHKYVPWVLVNGKPLKENADKFIEYVCKEYEGKSKPRACTSYSANSIPKRQSLRSVCIPPILFSDPAGIAPK